MKKFIISIDAGTTSNRSILFDLNGKPVFSSQKEFTQYFPKNGWVEHDPDEIWKTTIKTLKDVIKKVKRLKGEVLTIKATARDDAADSVDLGQDPQDAFDSSVTGLDEMDGNLSSSWSFKKPNTDEWNNDSIGTITAAEVSQSQT